MWKVESADGLEFANAVMSNEITILDIDSMATVSSTARTPSPTTPAKRPIRTTTAWGQRRCLPAGRHRNLVDGDGVDDNADAFPNGASETLDSDNDGVGDNADVFPNDASETLDTDNDGVGDNADAFPNDANEALFDLDGVGSNADVFPNDDETVDSDGDGVGDNGDWAPNDASKPLTMTRRCG